MEKPTGISPAGSRAGAKRCDIAGTVPDSSLPGVRADSASVTMNARAVARFRAKLGCEVYRGGREEGNGAAGAADRDEVLED